MKLTITHLKAPWPAGAKVGDVVEFSAVPVWAVGKFTPAADDAEVTAGDAIVASVVPPAAGRDAMEAEAKALGVSFNARTSDATLADRIAEAKAS